MKTIDLFFPVRGQWLSAHHQYALYAAISHAVPAVHGAEWFALHSVTGSLVEPGLIKLGPFARFGARLPDARVPDVLDLIGSEITVNGFRLCCGFPRIEPLKPSPSLWSRLVVVKEAKEEGAILEPNSFLAALQRQLSRLGIAATPTLERLVSGERDKFARRVVKIKNAFVAGYGVHLDNLSAIDSIIIQSKGLGGRRRLGCGVFVPVRTRGHS